ncbi:MAG TPA: histidine kinase [Gemmatimonadaceae bacterium]|nr:histidine kinase [Gemmatimonadaceae bacterium]
MRKLEEGKPSFTSNLILLNVGGWLLFGIGVMIGWTEIYPWHVNVVTTPPYLLIGFLLSLLLGVVYDRLEVGPASFGRALAITLVASAIAGTLWSVLFTSYQCTIANSIHSLVIGGPSRLGCRNPNFLDGSLDNSLPLFGWSLVRLAVQYNAALREQREQALQATATARDAQLRMLAYQLNPHFLFNTLNSIRALINEDRQQAREMVTALAGYLRYALVERPLHVALLEEEIASIRGYLAIEQARFEERLDVRMEIDPATLRCEVPAFLFNPLVENAVKHGAPGTADAPLLLRIDVRIVEPDRLRIVVENSGQWATARPIAPGVADGGESLPGGLGLANVRARLAMLHPGDHRIDIEQSDGRVRVIVELPARCRDDGRSET